MPRTFFLRLHFIFGLSISLLCSSCSAKGGNALYQDETLAGEVQQEELAAARQKLDEARERRRQGQASEDPSLSSSVAIKEMPSPKKLSDELSTLPPSPEGSAALFESLPEETSPSEDSTNLSSVEILWASSETPVAAYLIRYGFDRENLSEEIRIDASEVHIREDSEYGRVNSFVLRNIPRKQSVYVSLASVGEGDATEGAVSAFSEVLELQAE